jgi:hypothetical protein
MKRFSFYHKDTGVFAELIYSASEPRLDLNTPTDHVALEGAYHPLAHRFDLAAGAVVRADAPSADHAWSEATGRWELKPEVAAARAARRAALAEIARLEATQPRAVREAVLGLPGGAERLAAIDAEIVRLRQELVTPPL